MEDLADRQVIEQGFFSSLLNLSNYYNLPVTDYSAWPYPLNIHHALKEVTSLLEGRFDDIRIRVIYGQGTADKATLNTIRTFNTGNTLFYIPVEPMFRLMQNPAHQESALLMASLFAYLYQVVGVAHFCESGAYLDHVFDYHADWFEDGDFDQQDGERMTGLLSFQRGAGEATLVWMRYKANLDALESRVKDFIPRTGAETSLKSLATDFLELYKSYPGRSVYESIHETHLEEDLYYNYPVRLDQYLSFYWNCRDDVYDYLSEYIDADLQECTLMDEPTIVRYFDQIPAGADPDFGFEQLLFALLHRLCDCIHEFNNEIL